MVFFLHEFNCFQGFKVAIPHVTLVVVTVVYALFGGVLFYLIERPNEETVKLENRKQFLFAQDQLLSYAWNLTNLHNGSKIAFDEFEEKIGNKFDQIVEATYDAFQVGLTADTTISESTEIDNRWSYPSAVLFSTTVITTVGYGHIVPVTFPGRLICIIYALLGVPMALITIADIGKFVGQMLLTIYQKYRTLKKNMCRKRKEKKRLKSIMKALGENHPALRQESRKKSGDQRQSSTDLEYRDSGESETKLKEELEAALGVLVPPSVVLFVLLSYISLCALIFTEWEGWTFLNAFYFSFITMVTVGFGDLVPSPSHGAFLFLAIIIILIGLVLTTMSIDLVGTHYIRKIHYMGRRLQDTQAILKALGLKREKKWGYKHLIKIPIMSEDFIDFLSHQTGYTQERVLAFSYLPRDLFDDVGFMDSATTSTLHPAKISNAVQVDDSTSSVTTYDNSYMQSI